MVERYAHLSPDHKRQAIERLQVAATCSDPRVSQPLSGCSSHLGALFYSSCAIRWLMRSIIGMKN